MFVQDAQDHEQEALDEVCMRLSDRYASRGSAEVASVVHDVAEEFSEARVRDFVPVLVEHLAKDRLETSSSQAR